MSLGLLLPTTCVLGLARWLTPDPSGVGTHIQLGLEPCGIMSWLNFPCPMCGMTTTFSLMAHFRPIDAFVNQPFGVVLFIGTVIVFVIAAQEIVFPRKRWQRMWQWAMGREVYVVSGLLVGMLSAWVYKVAIMGDFFSWPA